MVAAAVDDALSPNTRRAYSSAWSAWTAFCEARGWSALPGAPCHVALYLAARLDAGASMPTLRLALAAISKEHSRAGQLSPASHSDVKSAMRGFARQRGGRQRQAKPLDTEAVAAVRRHLGDAVDTVPLAAATMSLVSVVSDAGLRRSEAAALSWEDIAVESDGSGRVTIRKSKSDQTGEGAVVAITSQAVADLRRWEPLQGGGGMLVWGIAGEQVHRRIAKVCRDAGLGHGYGGHSGRVGMAVRLTRANAPTAVVLRQGRWRDVRMLSRYTRRLDAATALRYL